MINIFEWDYLGSSGKIKRTRKGYCVESWSRYQGTITDRKIHIPNKCIESKWKFHRKFDLNANLAIYIQEYFDYYSDKCKILRKGFVVG
jgi:hypothetical protein